MRNATHLSGSCSIHRPHHSRDIPLDRRGWLTPLAIDALPSNRSSVAGLNFGLSEALEVYKVGTAGDLEVGMALPSAVLLRHSLHGRRCIRMPRAFLEELEQLEARTSWCRRSRRRRGGELQSCGLLLPYAEKLPLASKCLIKSSARR